MPVQKRRNQIRSRPTALRRCLKDDAAQALTEYAVLILMVGGICFYIYHPDNGFFKALRDRYELVTTVLILPGP